MKSIILTLIIVWVFFSSVISQNAGIIGSPIEISLDNYKSGEIQWQFSTNKQKWIDIKGAVNPELISVFSEAGYYRAIVKSCPNIYVSDTIYIEDYELLRRKNYWFKGNTHVHTTNSDGKLSPAMVVKTYQDYGYDFLFITDHNVITPTDPLSSFNFLCFPGVEVTIEKHINALNVKKDITLSSVKNAINHIIDQEGIPIVDHPLEPSVSWFKSDILKFEKINHIEIYNYITESQGYHDNQCLWDSLLSLNKKIFGIAADDSHRKEDIGKSFILVNTGEFKKDSIICSIKEGRFYSSTGIYISNLDILDSTIHIETYNADKIDFIGKEGKVLKTEASNTSSYKIIGDEQYIRIALFNKALQKAWTQPLIWNNKIDNKGIRINNSKK